MRSSRSIASTGSPDPGTTTVSAKLQLCQLGRHTMQKRFFLCATVAVLTLGTAGPGVAQNWKPVRPINLIVPWAAGGSTDQVTRVTAAELEKVLGQTIVIVNQPGASGAIGTKSALDAAKDGYTWTAGVTSAGHNAMELISKATGVKYRHVTYDGGNPAVVATVAGEAEVTTQLAVEQADMIRGKRLRPLAAVSEKPLELEGYGTIPPLSQTLPGFTAPANYFGIFVPNGVPDEVVKTLERIWAEQIVNSEALKKYATSRGALFNPLYGDAAQKAVFPAVQLNAWVLYEGGKAKVSPDTVGIPKP